MNDLINASLCCFASALIWSFAVAAVMAFWTALSVLLVIVMCLWGENPFLV
jgi:hypothetical protein